MRFGGLEAAGSMHRSHPFHPTGRGEARPYQPHITLARFHGPLRLNKSQHALPPSLQRSFTADTVNLYRSHLTPAGSHYEILKMRPSIPNSSPNSSPNPSP